MLHVIRLLAVSGIVALGLLWAFVWVARDPNEGIADAFMRRFAAIAPEVPPGAGGVVLPQGVALGGAFRLTDHTGRAVTEADFAGRFLLLYFGFTWCPDVCPTELGVIAATLDELGAEEARVVPVFVTIDPERDSVAQMADYVERFHPRMVGLTGSPEQIAEIARRYRVFYARVAPREPGGHYLMDHSSFIYLVGPDGMVRAMFRPNTAPEAIAATLRAQWRRE
jgi:protein SCO1/2